jgi:hypothetical protein
MSRRTTNGQAAETTTPVPDISDKARWKSRVYVSKALGISYETVPTVAYASNIRIKQLPGLFGVRFFLPDIERVARESVVQARQPTG